jgi:hypothetical protein
LIGDRSERSQTVARRLSERPMDIAFMLRTASLIQACGVRNDRRSLGSYSGHLCEMSHSRPDSDRHDSMYAGFRCSEARCCGYPLRHRFPLKSPVALRR